MVTGNMLVMFIVGFIIFCFYLFGLLYSIYWGHSSQRKEMENDPELRGYYSRHGQEDLLDYDGMGNQGRFPEVSIKDKRKRYDTQSTNDKKRNYRRRHKTKVRKK